jgi:tetratricopeptide (TPR) repeat protein
MIAAGDLDIALAYARVAESIYNDAPEAAPADVLERIATINEQIADRLLAGARASIVDEARQRGRTVDPASVPEIAIPARLRAEAQARLAEAADFFTRHARRVLTEPGRESAFLASLWAAADAYERAGRPDEAIDAMETYLGGGDSDDPRRPEVMFRLARVLESIGRLDDAGARYRQVIEEDPRTVGTRAHAPLARTLLAQGRTSEAEEVLLAVVEGRQIGDAVLTPDAADYRRALVDLGRLYYEHAMTMPGPDGSPDVDPGLARDRIRQAIERFDAALVREPDAADADEIRFWLADSHRRLGDLIAGVGGTPGDRRGFDLARAGHLETALAGYETVIEAWGDEEPALLDRRRRSMLRNALINRARTTYDLERWEQAARLYDAVARRYPDEHVSMQALVQIVNCYERMGEPEKADVAHRNAMLRLEQLPDAAFTAADALMDREAWSQWLRDRPAGRLAAASADDGGARP